MRIEKLIGDRRRSQGQCEFRALFLADIHLGSRASRGDRHADNETSVKGRGALSIAVWVTRCAF